MRLLFEASEPVAASVAQVRGLIDGGWVIGVVLGPGGDGSGAGRSYVDVDHRDGVVGFQGHWWFRGEVSVSELDGRTMLTYRVYNIARRGAWAVPLANRLFIGYGRLVRRSVADLARAIEKHLAERVS